MLAVLLVICLIIIIILSVGLYQKSTNAICLSRRRLDGKTAVVTGGTAGMGLMIATDLAERGATVIVGCPFQQEGDDAVQLIINKTKNNKVIFKHLDLASLHSVRTFVKYIIETEERLDILINNAGVGLTVDKLTADGINFVMQVNYYGAFLLTLLLVPLLKKTAKFGEQTRIITTSSVIHMIGQVDFDNVNRTNYWYKLQVYGNSKIFLVYFVNELSKKLKGSNVVINNVDPGAVGTKIFNSINIVIGTIATLFFGTFFKTPWYGAQTALHVALDDEAGQVSGAYFRNCEIIKPVARTNDEKIAKKLWEESVRIVKITDKELFECFTS